MNHLHGGVVPAPGNSGQTKKTVYYVEHNLPGSRAVLITRAGKRFAETTLQVQTPHEALDWCIKERASFIFIPGPCN